MSTTVPDVTSPSALPSWQPQTYEGELSWDNGDGWNGGVMKDTGDIIRGGWWAEIRCLFGHWHTLPAARIEAAAREAFEVNFPDGLYWARFPGDAGWLLVSLCRITEGHALRVFTMGTDRELNLWDLDATSIRHAGIIDPDGDAYH